MRLSASRMALAARCVYAFRADVIVVEAPSGAAQDHGTAVHAAIESALADRVFDLAPDLVPEFAAWHSHPVARFPWRPEIAFAYDPATDTATELTHDGHRDYSRAPVGSIVGTADAVCPDSEDRGGTVLVADWKVGRQADLEPARTNAQIRFLCLAAARATGATRAIGATVHVTPDEVIVDEAQFDAADLAGIAAEVRAIAARLASDPQPEPGAHCTRCPASAVCPATTAIVRRVPALPVVDPSRPIDRENAGRWHVVLDVLESFVESRKRALREVLAAGQVATETGVLRIEEQVVEKIDLGGREALAAREVLDAHGVAAAIEVKEAASWEAVRGALRAKGLKGKAIAEAEDAIRSELRAKGALRETTIAKVVERKNKANKGAA